MQRVAGLRPAVENENVSEDDIVSLGGKMALAFTMPSKTELEKIKRINRDAQQDYDALKLTEEQKEYLTALIDGGNTEDIEAFIRKVSSSKERKRRG